MSEHSKLPLQKNPKNGRVLFDADGNKVLTCQAKGPAAWVDAQLVLRAVNSHADLVAALERARNALKYSARFLRPEDADRDYVEDNIAIVDAALAKAKETP